MPRPHLLSLPLLALAAGCTVIYNRPDDPSALPSARVRPGITVLLSDSIGLVRGKRIALLTNASGVDEKRRSDIDLLRTDQRARNARVQLVELFTPEHGLSVREDHPGIPSGTDPRTGLPIFSLYGRQTEPPPDSAIRAVDAVVIDLPDVGTRTWTYEGALVYTMRAAARAHKPVIVLDRPNPITGAFVEGPVLDSSLANPNDPAPGRPGLAWALYPIPLRHGMTFGELARYYNAELRIGADLHVVPARGWTREIWFDRTGLPFIAPSPNLRSFESVMLYPALVPFEATNLSVGRGTATAFQRVGAPWLDAQAVVAYFKRHRVMGVRFLAEDFTPSDPGDGKYGGERIHGIRVQVTDREAMQTTRVFTNLFSVIRRLQPGRMTVDTTRFERLFGSVSLTRGLLRGDDPDAVADSAYGPAYAFRKQAQKYFIY